MKLNVLNVLNSTEYSLRLSFDSSSHHAIKREAGVRALSTDLLKALSGFRVCMRTFLSHMSYFIQQPD